MTPTNLVSVMHSIWAPSAKCSSGGSPTRISEANDLCFLLVDYHLIVGDKLLCVFYITLQQVIFIREYMSCPFMEIAWPGPVYWVSD